MRDISYSIDLNACHKQQIVTHNSIKHDITIITIATICSDTRLLYIALPKINILCFIRVSFIFHCRFSLCFVPYPIVLGDLSHKAFATKEIFRKEAYFISASSTEIVSFHFLRKYNTFTARLESMQKQRQQNCQCHCFGFKNMQHYSTELVRIVCCCSLNSMRHLNS